MSEAISWSTEALETSIWHRIKNIAEQSPYHIAIADSAGNTFTYQQLIVESEILAYHIHEWLTRQSNRNPHDPIGILMPHGSKMIITMLAVLRLGRAYLPLDPDHPRDRLLSIVHHAQCGLVVSDEMSQLANDINVVCPSISYKQIQQSSDLQGAQLSEAQHSLLPTPNVHDNAYILYTSGSTGDPKGVYQDQRGLLHDVMQYSQAINITTDDCFTGFYSPSVNGAIRDIWAALLNGAKLVPASPQKLGFSGMEALVERFSITIFHAIPPLLRAFLNSNPSPKKLRSIRCCYIAGDKFYSKEVATLYRYFPETCRIYTGIGSTECATLYRHWVLDSDTTLETELLPVGYAISDRHTRLVANDSLQEEDAVDEGEIGFVQVESEFLAKGYWRNEPLSKQCFLELTSGPQKSIEKAAKRRFMPGDRFRQLPNGLYEYLGRADTQVKIKGHRIDIADLERFSRNWLLELLGSVHPDACKVLAITHNTTASPPPEVNQNLVLIWVLAEDLLSTQTAISIENLRNELTTALLNEFPAAAQPHTILICDKLPRLPNYKLDMAALKKWCLTQLTQQELASKGTTKFHLSEQQIQGFNARSEHKGWLLDLLRLWCRFFQIEPHENIYNDDWQGVNADSLTIMNFFAELDNQFKIRIDYEHLPLPFNLLGLYQFLACHHGDALTTLKKKNDREEVTLVVVPPFVGLAGLPQFDHLLNKNIRLIKVPTTALYNPIGEMQPLLPEVVTKLVDYIDSLALYGPVYFYGISSGAKPAFLAASALLDKGYAIPTVFIGDAGPIGRAEHFGAERLRAFSWLTEDLPKIEATIIEIIALKERDNSSAISEQKWKELKLLGWYRYARQIGFITVPKDHVACLTDERVINLMNEELIGGDDVAARFSCNIADISEIKQTANTLFISPHPSHWSDAACYYRLMIELCPELNDMYGFNHSFSYARLKAHDEFGHVY